MATIEARGYVSFPEAKTTAGGRSFNKFSLGVKQVEKAFGDRPEVVTWLNLAVVDYKGNPLPAAKAYVQVKGMFKVRNYTKDGVGKTVYEVVADTVEDMSDGPKTTGNPASDGTAGSFHSSEAPPAKDPWE